MLIKTQPLLSPVGWNWVENIIQHVPNGTTVDNEKRKRNNANARSPFYFIENWKRWFASRRKTNITQVVPNVWPQILTHKMNGSALDLMGSGMLQRWGTIVERRLYWYLVEIIELRWSGRVIFHIWQRWRGALFHFFAAKLDVCNNIFL